MVVLPGTPRPRRLRGPRVRALRRWARGPRRGIRVRLPLKGIATLSRGGLEDFREGKQVVLVKMTADDGTIGWGESGPSRRWSAETTHSCYTSIRHYLAPALIGRDPFDIAGLHLAMNQEIAPGLDPGQPIAKAALDLAAHDLVCRQLGINLQSWLGAKGRDRVDLAYLVSAPGVEGTARSWRRA